MEKTLDAAIQDLINNNIPEVYLPKLKEFKENFTHKFKIDKQEEVVLVPKHTYNLILNSGQNTPKALAEELNKFLK